MCSIILSMVMNLFPQSCCVHRHVFSVTHVTMISGDIKSKSSQLGRPQMRVSDEASALREAAEREFRGCDAGVSERWQPTKEKRFSYHSRSRRQTLHPTLSDAWLPPCSGRLLDWGEGLALGMHAAAGRECAWGVHWGWV